MSEEEYMECSVVAYPRQIKFLHINGGAISYYVDRHVSDYVDRLQKENQELKKQLHEASIEMQEMIEQDIECPSNCSKLKELKKQLEEYDRKLFITKNELDMRQKSIDNKLNQQKEFIEMLEKEILDSKAGSSQQYYAKEHLRLFKEIIGGKDE